LHRRIAKTCASNTAHMAFGSNKSPYFKSNVSYTISPRQKGVAAIIPLAYLLHTPHAMVRGVFSSCAWWEGQRAKSNTCAWPIEQCVAVFIVSFFPTMYLITMIMNHYHLRASALFWSAGSERHGGRVGWDGGCVKKKRGATNSEDARRITTDLYVGCVVTPIKTGNFRAAGVCAFCFVTGACV
jgi:hypothetical protein